MNNDPMLDLRRLQVLHAVVDTGSVTAAATRLGYTPSSVSQQLSVLERETGVPLFEKHGRGIRPTEAGVLLAEHAVGVLRAVSDAEDAMADLREGRSGRVRVMSFTSAGDTLLPTAVAHLRRTRPVRPSRRSAMASSASLTARSTPAACSASSTPASVGRMPRPCLSNSDTPVSRSSTDSCWLTEDGV